MVLVGCASKRGPVSAVHGFELPVAGTLVMVADIIERRGSGSTTTKRFLYRHPVRRVEGGGLEIGTPAMVVERLAVGDRETPAGELASLGPMFAQTRPAFVVDGDGQFVGLASSVSDADLPTDRATMEATMRSRWRLVTEGWSGINKVGDPQTEQVTEPFPGRPDLSLVMMITRQRLPDGPCVADPAQQCRRRRLLSEVQTGPIVGEFSATITDHPGQHWPHRLDIERVSRRPELEGRPGQVVKSVERTELWTWEAAE